jgi:hypothetical protein
MNTHPLSLLFGAFVRRQTHRNAQLKHEVLVFGGAHTALTAGFPEGSGAYFHTAVLQLRGSGWVGSRLRVNKQVRIYIGGAHIVNVIGCA